MNKKIKGFSILFGSILLLITVLALVSQMLQEQSVSSASQAAVEVDHIQIDAPVIQDMEFGGIYLDITGTDMLEAGFSYGDSVTVEFSNGWKYENIPFYDGYYTRTGECGAVAYKGTGKVLVIRNAGDSTWIDADIKEGMTGTIKLIEPAYYLENQNTMDMSFTNERSDYDSDEEFANFRSLSGGNLKENLIYRGVSPVNNKSNRAKAANDLLELNNVRYVINLADNETTFQNYTELDDFMSDYYLQLYDQGNVDLVSLSVSYRSEEYDRKLAAAFTKMLAYDGPYFIHCTEGKDRTGFVCIVLEALAGASYEELLQDYMITYRNFYKITEKSRPDQYEAIINIRFNDLVFWLAGVSSRVEFDRVDIQQCAADFLIRSGMSTEDCRRLIELITE